MATFNYNKSFEDYLKEYYEQQKALQDYQKNKPGAYNSAYAGSIEDIRNKIANRGQFSYDATNDPLYQQYRNQYSALGKLAMQDTMGQAAQLTGGYGNSYANMVGQQTFNNYMRQAADKIPELADLAYKRYSDEGQDLYNRLAMYQDADNTAYGRYRDTVGDFYTQLNYLAGQADTAYNRGANRYNTDYGNAYDMWRAKTADEQYAQEQAFKREQYEYQKQQDAAEAAFAREKFAYQQQQDAYEAQRKAQEEEAAKLAAKIPTKADADGWRSQIKKYQNNSTARNNYVKSTLVPALVRDYGLTSKEAEEYAYELVKEVIGSGGGVNGGRKVNETK